MPRISYVDLATVSDPHMLEEFARARRDGTPRPESHAIRAHVPAVFWSFVNTWNAVFVNGVVDHRLKELCRVYVSKSVGCRYCGSQRSVNAARSGVTEADYDELLDFEKSARYDARQKAALALAQAITWDLETDDVFWRRLHAHFSDSELVELGYFVGFTMGQQRFLRVLDIPVGQASTATEEPGSRTARSSG